MDAEAAAGSAPGPATDAELLAAARLGNAEALETLLVRYQPRLYRFGLRMCGNVEDAGEVAQESLISMAKSLGDFRGESSVSSWLYTIARRYCIKRRRRSKFAPASEHSLDDAGSDTADRLVDPAPSPEEAAINRQLESALARAIEALESSQREVLVLRDIEGLPAAEVAGILGISVEAVKSRLHRGRIAVRQTLAAVLNGGRSDSPRARTCPDVVSLFSRHLEGEIDPAVCADMEAHLVRCDHCRDACASLKRVLAMCRELPTPTVPPHVAASIRSAIRAALPA